MALLPIYIMGKKYYVPEGYTVITAFEYAGYKMIRGCGCRAGVCGACATVYRLPGDYHLKVGLACQTSIQEGMSLMQIGSFPAHRTSYDLEKITDSYDQLMKMYPEIKKCMGCNTCTKSCPLHIEVMEYISASLRGDFESAAEMSFDCLMCGACTARCPAEISQFNIAMYVRRVYGRYILKKSEQLVKRTTEIHNKQYDREVKELSALSVEKLKDLYAKRVITKEKF